MKTCTSLSIILIIYVQNVSSQQLNRTYSNAPKYPNNDRIGLYSLAIPCIIFDQLSLAGCFYVLFGTFRRWKASRTGRLPMTLRIPFYISITDLLLYTVNLPNVLFTFVFHKPWPDPICGIIGFISNFFMNLNMILALMLSLLIYLRVCRNKVCSLGSYDWKLIVTIIISSITLSSISLGHYGNDTWWCASSRKYTSYHVIFSTFTIITTIIFCYIKVMRKIHLIDKLGGCNVSHKRLAEINYRFGVKAITYILIFVVQWFFSFPYHITRFTGDRRVWTFVLFGVSVNSGGVLNGLQYHFNEGWKIKPMNSDCSLSEQMLNASPNNQLQEITVTTTTLSGDNNSPISFSSITSSLPTSPLRSSFLLPSTMGTTFV